MKKLTKKTILTSLTAMALTAGLAVNMVQIADTMVNDKIGTYAFGHKGTTTVTIDISDYHINHVGAANGERFKSSDGKITFILYTSGGSPNAPLRLDVDGEWYEGYMPNISKSGGFYSQAGATSEGWYDLQVNVINSGGGTPTPPPVVEQPEPEPEPQPEPKPEPVQPKPEPVQPKPVEQPNPTPPAPAPTPVEKPKPVVTTPPVTETVETPVEVWEPEVVEEVVVVEETPVTDTEVVEDVADEVKKEEVKKDDKKEDKKEVKEEKKGLKGNKLANVSTESTLNKAIEDKETPKFEDVSAITHEDAEKDVEKEKSSISYPMIVLGMVIIGGYAFNMNRKRVQKENILKLTNDDKSIADEDN